MKSSVKLSLCALTLSPLALIAGDKKDTRWEFGGGVSYRVVAKTEFYGQVSQSNFEDVINAGPDLNNLPSDVGNGDINDGLIDSSSRTYDNGYVRRGSGTDNIPYTTNWGYDNANQINAQADTISFNRNLGESTRVTGFTDIDHNNHERPDDSFAPYIELARVKTHEKRKDIEYGIISTFTWLNTDAESGPVARSSADFETFDVDLVDTYDLNGIIPPTAPYQGGFTPPGPLLGFIPDRSIDEISTGSISTAWGFFDDELDLDVQTLSLGVLGRKLFKEGTDDEGVASFGRFSGQIEGGITLNRIDLDWDSESSIVVNNRVLGSQSSSDRDVEYKFGAYGALGINYRVDDEGKSNFALKARYDYLGKQTVGNSEWGAEVDLSSWSFILAYVRKF